MADLTVEQQLNSIKNAIRIYYRDLDTRQHGGVAQDKAFHKIQTILGMYWRQGEHTTFDPDNQTFKFDVDHETINAIPNRIKLGDSQ